MHAWLAFLGTVDERILDDCVQPLYERIRNKTKQDNYWVALVCAYLGFLLSVGLAFMTRLEGDDGFPVITGILLVVLWAMLSFRVRQLHRHMRFAKRSQTLNPFRQGLRHLRMVIIVGGSVILACFVRSLMAGQTSLPFALVGTSILASGGAVLYFMSCSDKPPHLKLARSPGRLASA